jgi:catalase
MARKIYDFRRHGLAGTGIVAIIGTLALAFAWASGWIPVGRGLTSSQLVQTVTYENPRPFPAGFRRAHGKGVCFVGKFRGNGNAASLSNARIFLQPDVPVTGRFSLGGGDPHGSEDVFVISMALLLRSDDGQQWRMAMNSTPYLEVATPQGVNTQFIAERIVPATGNADPAKMKAFLQAYPEAQKFYTWAEKAPRPDSWANTQYNSINAFRLSANDGRKQYFRWAMRPRAPYPALTAEQRAKVAPDFLSRDLYERLEKGPLYWDMVLTLAGPKDAINDPSQPWPAERPTVVAGTLEVTRWMDQANGLCRDINYDPTIVPHGVEISDDPVLAARSGAYAHSFNSRQREIARGQATDAVGVKDKP